MSNNIDALYICSKELLEPRIIELKKENEQLKLEIFWLRYGYNKLRDSMRKYNFTKVKCGCLTCIMSCRTISGHSNDFKNKESSNCLFGIEFNKLLNGLEIDISTENFNLCPLEKDDNTILYLHDNCYSNDNCHLVNHKNGDWCMIQFGKKIWNAKCINDINIIKYKKLITILNL